MILPIEDKSPWWAKALVGLIIAILVFNELALVFGATISIGTAPIINQVAYEYDDGTYFGAGPVATIAQHDKNVYSGIVFPDVVIPANASVINATLTLYYWNNLNYTEAPTNILIEAIPGNPSVIYPGLLRAPATTTTNYYTYDISGWDASGNYTLEITDIVAELQGAWVWNQTGNNILIRVQALAPVGPFAPGSEPDYYRYEISTNLGPDSQKPRLSVNYTESAGNTEYYNGYTIIQTYEGEFSGFLGGNNRLFHYSYEAPIGWYNYTLPATDAREWIGGNEQGWAVGDKLYLLLCNTTRVDLWYANLTDLTSYTNIGALRTTQPEDYCMAYNEAENTLYLYHQDVPGVVIMRTYNITSGVLSGSSTVINVGAYAGTGLDACYDPVNEYVWMVACSADTTGSQRHLYLFNCSGATYTQKLKGTSPLGGNFDNPNVDIFDNQVWLFGTANGASHYYQSYDLTTGADTSGGWVLVNNEAVGYTETIVKGPPVERLYYILDDKAVDNKKKIISYDTNAVKTTTYPTANYTGDDQLYTTRFTYYGNETILLEVENADKIYHFESPLTLGSGGPYTIAGFWSFYDTGLSFNLPNMAGIGTSEGATVFTVIPPTGGETPDPDCLALATTIEEVKACIDNVNLDDPDNPGAGGFSENDPWWVSRKQFKLYFLLLGLFFIAYPWVMFASTRDPQWVGYILMLNALGIGFLLAIMEI